MEQSPRIILATRVGDESAAPGRTATWLATRLSADLTLVYVATELQTVTEVSTAAALPPTQLRQQMIDEARERVVEWGTESLEGLSFDVVIEEGDVAERITAVARELGADLIVAGTEARGAIQGLIMGDTTRAILRRTPCPVVVVPPLAERR